MHREIQLEGLFSYHQLIYELTVVIDLTKQCKSELKVSITTPWQVQKPTSNHDNLKSNRAVLNDIKTNNQELLDVSPTIFNSIIGRIHS